MREEFKSQAAFFVRDRPQPLSEPLPQFEESTVRPLRSFVRLGRGRGQADLPKVRTAYLVDNAHAAEVLAGRHPHLHFVLPDGSWYRGNTLQAGRPAPSGPLVLKHQLRELVPQLQRAEGILVTLRTDTKAAETEVRRLSTELEAVRGTQQNHEKQLLAIEHKLRQSHQISREMQRALGDADQEIELLRADRSARVSQREEVLAEQAQLEAAQAQVDARSAELAAQNRAGQALAARLHEDHAKLRTEAAALAERHRAGKAALAHAESQLAELTRRQEHLRRQTDHWRADARRLVRENQDLNARIALSAEREQQLLSRIADTAKSLQESRSQTAALVEAIRDRRSQVEAVRRQCSAKEVELARAQADLVHLIASCTEELGEPIEAVAANAPQDLDAEALAKAEERHRRIKEKIQRLGPVNVLAREEFKRVSERLEFLESQQQDLLDAIRNTLEAIRELDTVSRERFDAAFEAINVEFRRVFASLFDGGLGEMRLTDPANPQESGIDIVAQPAGKRLRNVALLSGGEKSLTVMAPAHGDVSVQAEPFLHPGRGGFAARRSEHRPIPEAPSGNGS